MKSVLHPVAGLLLLVSALIAPGCGQGGGGGASPALDGGAGSPPVATADDASGVEPKTWTPLGWRGREPSLRYTLADGTLVSRFGGRVRDRHAREVGLNDPYTEFAPQYFERRTHEITIYENGVPGDPQARVLTVVVRPQWWWYDTNFRHSYLGRDGTDPQRPVHEALYSDNGFMKVLPAGRLRRGEELVTPLADYAALPRDPQNSGYVTDLAAYPGDGDFVLVKEIRQLASANRNLRVGDLLEFELGIFLAGPKTGVLGRFNYYADAIVYEVGVPGALPWHRGPCCDVDIPWAARELPALARAGGDLMTLHEDTAYRPDHGLLQAAPNIAGSNIQPFVEGRRLFHTSFLTGAHVEAGNPTLFGTQSGKAGPQFQQAACIACHVGNGKSSPRPGQPLDTMVVLVAGDDGTGALVPDPRFGTRLLQGRVTDPGTSQVFDGRAAVLTVQSSVAVPGAYPDGTPYLLQVPAYGLTDPSGAPLPLPRRMSVRAAPHLVGMGLLEAVPEETLERYAAESRRHPDGIAGRLQVVDDLHDPSVKRVGRFGWRATAATVEQQSAVALNADLGVTTSALPRHFCGDGAAGAACRAADSAGAELSDDDLSRITRYMSLLGVPPTRHFPGQQPQGVAGATLAGLASADILALEQAERQAQARVARGRDLFAQAGCDGCHRPVMQTGDHRHAELRDQTIRPYTDLLLHDMGPELADGFAQGVASGSEWRTAPLWGLGLLDAIDPQVRYLHDGRARSIEEAILWHGGQGRRARDRFKGFAADDRQSLIEFVRSL